MTERCIESERMSSERRSVGWGHIAIYEFPNELGDHPGLSGGAPITISWEHDRHRFISVEFFEQYRQMHPRRSRKELQLSSVERDKMYV